MRIWSIHPEHLDAKGLVALWRESLLARHVLEGHTKGYQNHPQLLRFKTVRDPLNSINQYLSTVYHEAVKRGYKFNKNKINWDFRPVSLTVTKGQIEFERKHLLNKLLVRDKNKYHEVISQAELKAHPLFYIIDGEIEDWEIHKDLHSG